MKIRVPAPKIRSILRMRTRRARCVCVSRCEREWKGVCWGESWSGSGSLSVANERCYATRTGAASNPVAGSKDSKSSSELSSSGFTVKSSLSNHKDDTTKSSTTKMGDPKTEKQTETEGRKEDGREEGMKGKRKTMKQLDDELREKLEGREGGGAGVAYEGGKPVTESYGRGVRSNIFRVI